MSFRDDPFTTCFDAEHFDGFIGQERIKEADGIGTAADAGDEEVGQAVFFFEDLTAGFITEDALEIADHDWIGVSAVSCAENVMSGTDIGDPIAHGFIDRFLKGLLAGCDRDDFCPEHFHAEDIEGLAFAIDRAHVNDAFQAKHGADRCGGDSVLPGAGFSDDAGFSHSPGEENLAHGIVDFMSARMEEIFALEVNARAIEFAGETFGEVKRGGASAKFAEVIVELLLKFGIVLGAEIFLFQLLEGMHQRFGNITSTESAETAMSIG